MTATLEVLRVWSQADQWMTFFVAGLPAPQPRVEYNRHTGRKFVPTPGPKTPARWNKLFAWRSRIAWATKLAVLEQKWTTVPAGVPVEISLDFYHFPPKTGISGPQYAAIAAPSRLADEVFWILKPTLPDRDNLDKAVLDTMKGLGESNLWEDDGQASLGRLVKWYSVDFSGVLIHVATGKALSEIERPTLDGVPLYDFDDGPALARGG